MARARRGLRQGGEPRCSFPSPSRRSTARRSRPLPSPTTPAPQSHVPTRLPRRCSLGTHAPPTRAAPPCRGRYRCRSLPACLRTRSLHAPVAATHPLPAPHLPVAAAPLPVPTRLTLEPLARTRVLRCWVPDPTMYEATYPPPSDPVPCMHSLPQHTPCLRRTSLQQPRRCLFLPACPMRSRAGG